MGRKFLGIELWERKLVSALMGTSMLHFRESLSDLIWNC